MGQKKAVFEIQLGAEYSYLAVGSLGRSGNDKVRSMHKTTAAGGGGEWVCPGSTT